MKRKGEEVRESPAYAPVKVSKGRVPRLRFPEFRKAGEWEAKSLGDLCEVLDEKRKPISGEERRTGAFPYYGASGIISFIDGFIFDEPLLLLGEDGAKWGAFEKTAFMAYGKYWVNNHAHVLRSKDANAGFLENYLYKADLKPYVTGNAPSKLTQEKMRGIQVPIPPYRMEQDLIAACLSSLDELIAAHNKKLEALKACKKGLMQKLFPAEGEGRPRLRFPEFRKAGEWEEKSLGSFSAIVRGGSPRPIEAYLTTAPEGLNWLKIGDLDQESKYVTATKEKVLPSAIKKTREVFPGDLILSNSMSFGRPYILRIQTCIHDGWIAISKIIDAVDTEFLYYSILSSSCQKYFTNNAAGAVVQNLNADIIKLLPIALPSLPEQKKIAATLSSLDSLLAAQGRKLEALREHKRGLLQGLFPRAEEE